MILTSLETMAIYICKRKFAFTCKLKDWLHCMVELKTSCFINLQVFVKLLNLKKTSKELQRLITSTSVLHRKINTRKCRYEFKFSSPRILLWFHSFGKVNIARRVQLSRKVLNINKNGYQISIFKLIKQEKVTTLIAVNIGSCLVVPSMSLNTHIILKTK